METRANYAIIGLFTLAVVAAGFGFVYWFSGRDRAGQRLTYDIVFDSSVSGLTRGSQVLFNGIRKGEVTEIRLDRDDPKKVVATIAVDHDTPMLADTEARLEYQGLTGAASVQLTGGNKEAGPVTKRSQDGKPLIEAKRSDFQDILSTVRKLAERADDVLVRVDRLIADNQQPVTQTISNIKVFTDALANNADGVNRFLSSTSNAADRIASLSVKLEQLSDSVDTIVKAIDPPTVSQIVGDVKAFTGALAANRDQVDQVLKDVASLVRQLNLTAPKLDVAIADIGAVAKAFDPAKLGRTVDNIERFAATLGANDANIDKVIKDFAQITGRLDSVVATIDLNTPQIDALLKDAAALARQLNQTAPKLDAAIVDISAVAKAFDPAKLGRTVDNIERFAATLGANDANIDKVLKEASAITGKLDQLATTFDLNRPQIDSLLKDAAALARQLNQTAPRLDAAIADISNVARAFDPVKLGRTVDNIERFAATLGANDANVDKVLKDAAAITGKLDQVVSTIDLSRPQIEALLKDAAALARQLNVSAPKLDAALADIGNIARAIDPAKVGRTVENIDRVAAVFGGNEANIDKALREIASITGKLDQAANRIDGVLAAAQKFLGAEGGEGTGAFAEIAETARSIRVVAQNLDKRVAEITNSITQFTGPGLREYQALASDGRRAVGEIQRLLRSLERNPQQLIFGGRPAIPEFRGSR